MILGGFDFDFFVQIFLMLEAKFGYVNLFLVDDAFLYPLKTSEKALSVPDLLSECSNKRFDLTEFTYFNIVLPL